jgi:RNA polymerase sigma-70 factor, ECF subfamily
MRDEAPGELIRRAGQDRVAFGQVYDHYLPRVYAFCRKYSQNREDAEDLTAEVFEKALAAISRYEDRGVPFSAWLLRIAANCITDRSRRRQAPLLTDHDLAQLREDSFLHGWEQTYWLHVHVMSLPPDQREVVRRRFYDDQPFADISRQMGRSEGAVKQLLRRALRALNHRLAQERAEDSAYE